MRRTSIHGNVIVKVIQGRVIVKVILGRVIVKVIQGGVIVNVILESVIVKVLQGSVIVNEANRNTEGGMLKAGRTGLGRSVEVMEVMEDVGSWRAPKLRRSGLGNSFGYF